MFEQEKKVMKWALPWVPDGGLRKAARSRVSEIDDAAWIGFIRFDRREEEERSPMPLPITKE